MSGECFQRFEEKVKKYVLVNSDINLRADWNYTAPKKKAPRKDEIKNDLQRWLAVPF